MNPVTRIIATMAPLDRANVDTDQIMPKQFLKRIERTGFGPFTFHDWRKDPEFILNRAEHQTAHVLVTGANFGCGSSREHAPWGLQDAGFAAIIAPSFADIFQNNSAKIGLLCVPLDEAVVGRLMRLSTDQPETECRIDLKGQTVEAGDIRARFDIDPFVKHRLLNGLDDIGLTMQHADDITAFESNRRPILPTTEPAFA